MQYHANSQRFTIHINLSQSGLHRSIEIVIVLKMYLYIYLCISILLSRSVVTAIQGLIDAADEQLNVRDVQRSRNETDTETDNETDLNKVRPAQQQSLNSFFSFLYFLYNSLVLFTINQPNNRETPLRKYTIYLIPNFVLFS